MAAPGRSEKRSTDNWSEQKKLRLKLRNALISYMLDRFDLISRQLAEVVEKKKEKFDEHFKNWQKEKSKIKKQQANTTPQGPALDQCKSEFAERKYQNQVEFRKWINTRQT